MNDMKDFNPGSAALYLPGEVEGVVAAELQHVLQLLRSGGDQRDRLRLRSLLQLPQTTDELGFRRIHQTWRRRRRRRRRREGCGCYSDSCWREALKH